jgi:hypothetical protein
LMIRFNWLTGFLSIKIKLRVNSLDRPNSKIISEWEG